MEEATVLGSDEEVVWTTGWIEFWFQIKKSRKREDNVKLVLGVFCHHKPYVA